MATYRLLGFDVWSVAKCSAAIYMIIALVVGLFMLLAGAFGPGQAMGQRIAFIAAPIWLPLIYGILGFLLGALVAAIYNFVARRGVSVSFVIEESSSSLTGQSV